MAKKSSTGKQTHSLPYPYVEHNPHTTPGVFKGMKRLLIVGDNWISDTGSNKPIVILTGFSRWKCGFVAELLPEYRTAFIAGRCPFLITSLKLMDLKEPPAAFISWGRKTKDSIAVYAKIRRVPVYRIEDGFIRSADLGARRVLPYSLVLDKTGIYFDGYRSSDLETLMNTAEVTSEEKKDAEYAIKLITLLNLSKYNLPSSSKYPAVSESVGKKRVVVIGQVDKDLSLVYGNPLRYDTHAMLRLAAKENPDAEILFRPHPEVYNSIRENKVSYNIFKELATISPPTTPLPDVLKTADHVYVISSLSGFEAVLRGILTTVLGTPFYAGYGFTDDRASMPRRTRSRSIEECFALAYIRYPRYLPDTKDNMRGLIAACLHINADRDTLSGSLCLPIDSIACLSPGTDIQIITRMLIRLVKKDASKSHQASELLEKRFPDTKDSELYSSIVKEAHRFIP